MTVEDYINSIDEPLKAIVRELRLTVMSVSRNFKEEIKWNVPTYSINKNICSIMAHKRHVNLQIFQGARIKDADKLPGTGKLMRHIRYEDLLQVNKTELKNFLQQAIKVDQ